MVYSWVNLPQKLLDFYLFLWKVFCCVCIYLVVKIIYSDRLQLQKWTIISQNCSHHNIRRILGPTKLVPVKRFQKPAISLMLIHLSPLGIAISQNRQFSDTLPQRVRKQGRGCLKTPLNRLSIIRMTIKWSVHFCRELITVFRPLALMLHLVIHLTITWSKVNVTVVMFDKWCKIADEFLMFNYLLEQIGQWKASAMVNRCWKARTLSKMDVLSLIVVALICFLLCLFVPITVYIHLQHRKYAHIPGPPNKGIKG